MNTHRMPFLRANSTRKLFKKVCRVYDLVYFGTVSQHSDEHQMVRGFTLSPSHVDRHYCVGTVSGRDVILLERTDTISFPDKPSKAYTWVILQIDLKKTIPVHVMLNACKYDDLIAASLMAHLSHLHQFDQLTTPGYDEAFGSRFRMFAPLQHTETVFRVIDPGTASVLGHHFSMFDYEVLGDALIVYLPSLSPQLRDIEHMLKSGIWLASQLDGYTYNLANTSNAS